MSAGRLVEELALAQLDTETRFRARAEAGSVEKELGVSGKLDKPFGMTA